MAALFDESDIVRGPIEALLANHENNLRAAIIQVMVWAQHEHPTRPNAFGAKSESDWVAVSNAPCPRV